VNDLQFAIRQLLRRPGISAVAIFTLALGMGLTTVAFTAVNSLFIKGPAGADIPGTGWILTTSAGAVTGNVSQPEFDRFAAATGSAMLSAAQGRMTVTWRHDQTSETVWALLVSSEFFPIVGATAAIGRLPARDETAAAVVTERFWRERLKSAAPGTTTLTLNGADFAVVGVLADSFRGPGGTYAPEVWVPLEARRALQLPRSLEERERRWLGLIGRVRDGVTEAEADARLKAEAAAMATDWPNTHAQRSVRFVPMRDGHPELRTLRPVAWVGMIGVGLVLMLAFFNVAGLLLARAVDREREMGIRAAVGASSGRLLRQLLTESLVLATLAGALALVVAQWSQRLLAAFAIPIAMPQRIDLSTDRTVVVFVGAMTLVAAIVPSLAPAWHSARVDLVRALTPHGLLSGGGRPSRARRLLVAAQVTGSTMMLTIAALFVRSFVLAAAVDPGFEVERALVVDIEPASKGYDATRSRLLLEDIVGRVGVLPGIEAAALTDRIPYYIGYPRTTRVGRAHENCADGHCQEVWTYAAGARLFETMRIPLVAGREFDGSPATANGVVVSESFAREYFGRTAAVGETIRLGVPGEPRTVIGVARDTLHRDFVDRARPILYVPMADADYRGSISIFVRSTSAAGSVAGAVTEAIYRADPAVPAESIATMTRRLEMPRWPAWTASGFFGTCGLLALVLATVGLFAVISQAVTQRMREFGLRLALGATSRDLLAHVFRGGVGMVLPGLALGMAIACALASTMATPSVGIDVRSPITYASVAAIQSLIAATACLAPARRAARVDPLTALRAD
jgi:predicted permease